MATLALEGVTKAFGAVTAVRSVSLEVPSGQFCAILGPSGCGKTTLLRMIAGFERPTEGRIILAGGDVAQTPPQDRGIGMVFQNYALFPHMSVFDNVAFGLRARRVDEHVIKQQVRAALSSVRLEAKERSAVPTLSGGEQQRVAVARALVLRPRLLLFDEPLSNLDVALRAQTREEIRAIQRETRITTMYVTHDQAEAMGLADRIAIMRAGALEQAGTPAELYDSPANAFVAEFLGSASLLFGVCDGRRKFRSEGGLVLRVPDWVQLPPPGTATLALKPEALSFVDASSSEGLPAMIDAREFAGFTTVFRLSLGGTLVKALIVSSPSTCGLDKGSQVRLQIDWRRCALFPGRG